MSVSLWQILMQQQKTNTMGIKFMELWNWTD